MKRIDIFGAPGVGKTTILNSLIKSKKDRIWSTSTEAKHRVLYDNFKKISINESFPEYLIKNIHLYSNWIA